MPIASGSFEVTTEAQPPFVDEDGNKLNHNVVRKDFSGDLSGSSELHMVAAFTGTPGSAGYVAIEHFTGTLAGKSGSCVLQHSGLMNKGDADLDVTIVPDSGTGELTGISGTMEIDNNDGAHSYTLDYDFD